LAFSKKPAFWAKIAQNAGFRGCLKFCFTARFGQKTPKMRRYEAGETVLFHVNESGFVALLG
jgi:hypothetical protein